MSVSSVGGNASPLAQLQQWRNAQASPDADSSSQAFAALESSVAEVQENAAASATDEAASGATATGASATSAGLSADLQALLTAAANGGSSEASESNGTTTSGAVHHSHHHHGGGSNSATDALTPTADQLIDPTDASTSSTDGAGLPQFLLDALSSGQTTAQNPTTTQTQS